MSSKFFSKLSQNFMEILDDDEYYDITIEVGQDSKVQTFRAHMVILNYRSAYFRRNFSTNKTNSNGILAHIELPKISPNIFQIVLKYIYGGILVLDDIIDPSDIVNLLVAAESLNLQEIVNHLQSYLIENQSDWMEEHFALIHNIMFQHDSLIELQKFCADFMSKYPEKIFKSIDFTSITEKSLISLIKRDDLKMEEIDVWDHVLKWGLAQNPTLLSDPESWSVDDFKLMENTLQQCLPSIRFFQLSSKEFSKKVIPYQKLLKPQLYKDLMNYYLDDDNTKIILTVEPARGSYIDSKLITNKIAAYIASWIDKMENKHPIYGFTPYSHLNNPYEFKLLLRGSRDGFDPKTFHELCDNEPITVSIVKVKGSGILGGYNPLTRQSCNINDYLKTNDSFIFSFTFMNLKDVVLSRVNRPDFAIMPKQNYGPCFGNDLVIIYDGTMSYYQKKFYEKQIRPIEGDFDLEEFEVFQIVKKSRTSMVYNQFYS